MDDRGLALHLRLGIPRAPLSTRAAIDGDCVLAWLPRVDADGKPMTWTPADARRLAFARWLRDQGRISG